MRNKKIFGYQGGGGLPPHIDIDEIGNFLYGDKYNKPYNKKPTPMTNPRGTRPINYPKPQQHAVRARNAATQIQRLGRLLQQQKRRGQVLRYLRMMGGMSRLGYPGLMAATGLGVIANTTPPLTPRQGLIGPDHYMGVGSPKYRRGGTSCRTPYRLRKRR